ncbi:hypothetical protein ECANGB1_1414 [Enterospora canceri]|uniref:Uncharacterized protein n=1 Tax=Enterospora canceri TaxID=1081671 RepID=A0A1Y1S643_9MICR|nr:hypothetical protein ECANGB1_1414 [Enterospora canceri]
MTANETTFSSGAEVDEHEMTSKEKMLLCEIAEVSLRIKEKTEEARNHTNKLKSYNFKIKALLDAIDAYSYDETAIKVNKFKKVDSFRITAPEKQNLPTNFEKMFANETSKIKIKAKGLLALVSENKQLKLDDIVKVTKLSKYKTIEILNIYVRNGILNKRFDKGFIYEIA